MVRKADEEQGKHGEQPCRESGAQDGGEDASLVRWQAAAGDDAQQRRGDEEEDAQR